MGLGAAGSVGAPPSSPHPQTKTTTTSVWGLNNHGQLGLGHTETVKAPTLLARVMVGGTLGAAIAGTAATGLTGNRHPPLALLALGLGATLGMLGASALRAVGPEPPDRKRMDAAADPAAEAAREQRRR